MLAMEEFFQICIKFKESFTGILLFDTLYQPEKAPRQVYHMFIGLNSGGEGKRQCYGISLQKRHLNILKFRRKSILMDLCSSLVFIEHWEIPVKWPQKSQQLLDFQVMKMDSVKII